MQKPKVLVIVGPTAVGKTSLSIQLAQKFNGEVVSADSRQVYRGLNLGTGKVTIEEMQGIPHHLLDVADPQGVYTTSDFKRDADAAIADILSRDKLPIIVGGTFFYVDTLLGNISLPEVSPNETLRKELATLSLPELITRLRTRDPARLETIDTDNPRRLIRAIEIAEALGAVPPSSPSSRYQALKLGITIPKETLHENIHQRLLARLEAGMIDEVVTLHQHGLSYERMEDLGLEYRYSARYLQGLITKETMVTELETKIRQFAKRQLTWLKRDTEIVWVNKSDSNQIELLVNNFIENNTPRKD